MDVDSDGGDHFDVTDSEDEKGKGRLSDQPVEATKGTPREEETKRVSTLATTKACLLVCWSTLVDMNIST